jgi:hypothetical protein
MAQDSFNDRYFFKMLYARVAISMYLYERLLL